MCLHVGYLEQDTSPGKQFCWECVASLYPKDVTHTPGWRNILFKKEGGLYSSKMSTLACSRNVSNAGRKVKVYGATSRHREGADPRSDSEDGCKALQIRLSWGCAFWVGELYGVWIISQSCWFSLRERDKGTWPPSAIPDDELHSVLEGKKFYWEHHWVSCQLPNMNEEQRKVLCHCDIYWH